jgi:pSer/pThr/pTyr-binding forkhead associated (FHA) protein
MMSQPQTSGQPNLPVERVGAFLESATLAAKQHPVRSAVERSGTVIETDEEVQHAIRSSARRVPQAMPAVLPVASLIPPAVRGASPYRPPTRPPLALLTVYDDGKLEGEVVRIRSSRFVIGRTEGDLCIPFDGLISSRHLEITCQQVGGMNRWVITDLQSKNGLFVRVSKTPLVDQAEFLVGRGRYRVDAMHVAPAALTGLDPSGGPPGKTRGWGEGTQLMRPAALTEMVGAEIGSRIILVKAEYWIGSDPSCPICRSDDPFCEPHHVRLYRGSKENWHVQNNKSSNGLWVRMPQITVDSLAQFQIGEQRFRLKIL